MNNTDNTAKPQQTTVEPTGIDITRDLTNSNNGLNIDSTNIWANTADRFTNIQLSDWIPKITRKGALKRLRRFFPFYRWVRRYTPSDLVYDLIAGLTVGMTIVPQSLAYATIAGLPIQYGLYSSFMGAFMYAMFGTSKDVTYGPTAVMSLLVYQYTQNANVNKFIPNPSSDHVPTSNNFSRNFNSTGPTISQITTNAEYNNAIDNALKIHYAILMTFMCGLLQILMGFMRLGFLISFISHPVLYGFTNAAAIIIGFGQIKNIFGIKVPKSTFLKEVVDTFRYIGRANPWDTALGVISLVLLIFMKKLNRSTWLSDLLFPRSATSKFNNLQTYDQDIEKAVGGDNLIDEKISIVAPVNTPPIEGNVEQINRRNSPLLSYKEELPSNGLADQLLSPNDDPINKISGLPLIVNTKLINKQNNGGTLFWWIIKKAFQKFVWLILTGRNAVIIALSAIIAYFLLRSQLFRQKHYHISLTPSINDHIPPFRMPQFAFRHTRADDSLMPARQFSENGFNGVVPSNDIYIPATAIFKDIGFGFVTITLIGILESLAIAKAFARKHKYTIDSTQEFVALGVSNFMSSFVSSYPITASFSRTAINSQTGVRTPAGGIFTGALVLFALQYLTQYFKFIPKASLAAMILSAVLNLIDFRLFYKIWKVKKPDFVCAMVSLLACFFLGVEIGICSGIVVSLAFLVFPISRPYLYISYEKVDDQAMSKDSDNLSDTFDLKPPSPSKYSVDKNDINGDAGLTSRRNKQLSFGNVKKRHFPSGGYYVIRPNQSLFYPSSEYFGERVVNECLIEPVLDLELLSSDSDQEPNLTRVQSSADALGGAAITFNGSNIEKTFDLNTNKIDAGDINNKTTEKSNISPASSSSTSSQSSPIKELPLTDHNNNPIHTLNKINVKSFTNENKKPLKTTKPIAAKHGKKKSSILADVVIDCSHIQDMDFTIIQEIEELNAEFKAMNKELILCNINEILQKNAGHKLAGIKIIPTLSQAKAYLSGANQQSIKSTIHPTALSS